MSEDNVYSKCGEDDLKRMADTREAFGPLPSEPAARTPYPDQTGASTPVARVPRERSMY